MQVDILRDEIYGRHEVKERNMSIQDVRNTNVVLSITSHIRITKHRRRILWVTTLQEHIE